VPIMYVYESKKNATEAHVPNVNNSAVLGARCVAIFGTHGILCGLCCSVSVRRRRSLMRLARTYTRCSSGRWRSRRRV
jgi:hypothetical protein